MCRTWLSVSAQRLCVVVCREGRLENTYPKIRGRMPVTAEVFPNRKRTLLVWQGGGNQSKVELAEGEPESRASKTQRNSRQGGIANQRGLVD